MKHLALFLGLPVVLFVLTSCEKELKEHPIPPAVKEEMERKIKASQTGKQVSGSVSLAENTASSVPKEAVLFVFARPLAAPHEGPLTGGDGKSPDGERKPSSAVGQSLGTFPPGVPPDARRAQGGVARPPLAVKRYSLVKFPFEYRIGQADAMLEGTIFDGKLAITARLDMDGNRVSSPGDLEGVVAAQAGDKDVNITLTLVTE